MHAISEPCSLPLITFVSSPISMKNDKIHLIQDQDPGEVKVSMQNLKYLKTTAVVLH